MWESQTITIKEEFIWTKHTMHYTFIPMWFLYHSVKYSIFLEQFILMQSVIQFWSWKQHVLTSWSNRSPLSVYNSVPQKRTWLQSSVEITCFSPIPAFEEDKSFFWMERREKHGPKTRVGWRISVLFCKRKHWLLLWREEGYWYIEKSFIKIEAECVGYFFFRKIWACCKLPAKQWQIFDFFQYRK